MIEKAQFADVLYGIALGDAIGYPFEFEGNTTEDLIYGRLSYPHSTLLYSDDTQMTLFCAEALAKANNPLDADKLVRNAYLGWLSTQNVSSWKAYKGFHQDIASELVGMPEMHHSRAPGVTCITAMCSIACGDVPHNYSKGNGTVMRCMPYAFWGDRNNLSLDDVVDAAMNDAEITHKHPVAAQCSGFLTSVYFYRLAHGSDLRQAVKDTLGYFDWDLPDEVIRMLQLIAQGEMFPDLGKTDSTYFPGTADAALVQALNMASCGISQGWGFVDTMVKTAATPGDSDTVASIAGGLAVAFGMDLPAWGEKRLMETKPLEYVISLYP